MKINWFPGHMEKARKQIEIKLKVVDFIIELVDARIPFSSHNPLIEIISYNKPKLLIFTKKDLCDTKQLKVWKNYYQNKGYLTLALNLINFNSFKNIIIQAELLCQNKRFKEKQKGLLKQPLRAMVVGIPNVGKSTFINKCAKKSVVSVANRPGHTKGQQWIKVSNNLFLLDTPGILWPKIINHQVALNLAITNSIKTDIIVIEDAIIGFAKYLQNHYFQDFTNYFGVVNKLDIEQLSIAIAQKYQMLIKNNQLDLNRAQNKIFNDIINSVLGKFTYEQPTDFANK